MPDDEPLYVVKGATTDGVVKFWTGKMNGSWPEYLRDRARAHQVSQSIAKLMATQFNQRTTAFLWEAELAVPA
jgi:hypothetical protein